MNTVLIPLYDQHLYNNMIELEKFMCIVQYDLVATKPITLGPCSEVSKENCATP
jgi:hypothetical protein